MAIRMLFYSKGVWKKLKDIDLDFNLTRQEDEHLGLYWDCLKGKSQIRWLAKELYQRETMGIK